MKYKLYISAANNKGKEFDTLSITRTVKLMREFFMRGYHPTLGVGTWQGKNEPCVIVENCDIPTSLLLSIMRWYYQEAVGFQYQDSPRLYLLSKHGVIHPSGVVSEETPQELPEEGVLNLSTFKYTRITG